MRLLLCLPGNDMLCDQSLRLLLCLGNDSLRLFFGALQNLDTLAGNDLRLADLIRDIQAHLFNQFHDIAGVDQRLAGKGKAGTVLDGILQLIEQLLYADLGHCQSSLCKRRAVIS